MKKLLLILLSLSLGVIITFCAFFLVIMLLFGSLISWVVVVLWWHQCISTQSSLCYETRNDLWIVWGTLLSWAIVIYLNFYLISKDKMRR